MKKERGKRWCGGGGGGASEYENERENMSIKGNREMIRLKKRGQE